MVTFTFWQIAIFAAVGILFVLLPLWAIKRIASSIPPACSAPGYKSGIGGMLLFVIAVLIVEALAALFMLGRAAGEALRRLHLMEEAAIGDAPFPFMGEGDGVVAAGYPKWEPDTEGKDRPATGSGRTGKVWINAAQYFDAVPELAWNFPIGGYTPAQKWLKDRRGRALGWDDIRHYQKIIKILTETDRIMQQIELPLD